MQCVSQDVVNRTSTIQARLRSYCTGRYYYGYSKQFTLTVGGAEVYKASLYQMPPGSTGLSSPSNADRHRYESEAPAYVFTTTQFTRQHNSDGTLTLPVVLAGWTAGYSYNMIGNSIQLPTIATASDITLNRYTLTCFNDATESIVVTVKRAISTAQENITWSLDGNNPTVLTGNKITVANILTKAGTDTFNGKVIIKCQTTIDGTPVDPVDTEECRVTIKKHSGGGSSDVTTYDTIGFSLFKGTNNKNGISFNGSAINENIATNMPFQVKNITSNLATEDVTGTTSIIKALKLQNIYHIYFKTVIDTTTVNVGDRVAVAQLNPLTECPDRHVAVMAGADTGPLCVAYLNENGTIVVKYLGGTKGADLEVWWSVMYMKETIA